MLPSGLAVLLLGWRCCASPMAHAVAIGGGHFRTPADEVVLGSDGRQLILLTRQGGRPKIGPRQTRIAAIEGAPWTSGLPRMGAGAEPRTGLGAGGENWFMWTSIPAWHGRHQCALDRRLTVWLSGRRPDGLWSSPWPLPGLNSLKGQATFAMFDPIRSRGGSWWPCGRIQVRGGHPRGRLVRGRLGCGAHASSRNYSARVVLGRPQHAANEWASGPAPASGGWLARSGWPVAVAWMPWWCPGLPLNEQRHFGDPSLAGHTLTVQCEGIPVLRRMSREVVEVTTGIRWMKLFTDAPRGPHGGAFDRGKRYRWSARSVRPGTVQAGRRCGGMRRPGRAGSP